MGNIPANALVALLSDESGAFGAGMIAFNERQATLTLFVVPERRRQGFGDLLLRTMLLGAAAANAFTIKLLVPKDLEAWPRTLGFTEPSRDRGAFVELFAFPEDIEWSACKS